MNRIAPSLAVYIISVIGAYLAAGFVHVQSDRALHGLFPNSYQVRQFSVYLLDAIPFYLICVYIVALIVTSAIYRRLHATEDVPFLLWLIMGLFAALLAVLLHSMLFPTSVRALVFLMIMSVFFSAAYPVVGWVLFGWLPVFRRMRSFPVVPSAIAGLLTGLVFAVSYVLVLRVATGMGYAVEEETYNSRLEPTTVTSVFRSQSPVAGDNERQRPYTRTAPNPGIFQRERFVLDGGSSISTSELSRSEVGSERDFGGRSFRFLDLDKNGFTDIVFRNQKGAIELWLNEKGKFTRSQRFLSNVENNNIHDYYFADYDNDGKTDLIVSRFVLPRTSSFENSFLKKIYWYPSQKPNSFGALYRQRSLEDWEDVTQKVFPEGAPWAFRKVEPILWFDANADGLLDFVWSQYPHPRRPLNWLYVQNDDGTFSDRFGELLSGSSDLVYAEGSDVADYDNDGDIDLFAYGFLYQNDNGRYRQICGAEMPGMFCDAAARNDEGGTFEDFNGDGKIDLALSYHGTGAVIPKYYLQLFGGIGAKDGTLSRLEKYERQYYGFHSYLRAKDFDFNGIPDLMTVTPGRLLTVHDGKWQDLMPAIASEDNGPLIPLGWIDIDEDGDWDFLATDRSSDETLLFRNNYNPSRYLKIALAGKNGVDNQIGATLRIRLEDGRELVHAHRPMGGYAGVADPRLIFIAEPNIAYEAEACFASLPSQPQQPVLPVGINVDILPSSKPKCVNYRLRIDDDISRVDLTLIADSVGALATVSRHSRN